MNESLAISRVSYISNTLYTFVMSNTILGWV